MKRIAVVDDDKVSLMVAKRMLSWEYDVITASSGEAGIALITKELPDLILLNTVMSKMDGFEVITELRKNKETCQIPVIFIIANERGQEIETKCFEAGATDYVSKPFVPIIVMNRIRRALELENYRKHLEKTVLEQLNQITDLQNNIILTLANIIESRDGTTGEHVKRTSAYTRFLMEKLYDKGVYKEQIDIKMIDNVSKAAPMHDIGKITVPDSILRKTDKLTDEEFSLMKLHTVAGYDIIKKNLTSLADEEFVTVASSMARWHHERFDGKGYPDGLAGYDIPLCARILAVADVYDALTSVRSYKKAFTTNEALSIMTGNEGQFEPILIQTFAESAKELEKLTESLQKK